MDTPTLCLAALALGEASGYEIKKRFESAFRHFQHAGYGSIYPALKRLGAEGLVAFREEQDTPHPAKKVFSLTPAGDSRLQTILDNAEPSEKYRSDFLLLVFMAHLMSTERLAQILDAQAQRLRAEVAELESISAEHELTAGMQFTIDFGLDAKRARLASIEKRQDALLEAHRAERTSTDEASHGSP